MDVAPLVVDDQQRKIASQQLTLLVVFHFLFVFICLAEIGIMFLLYLVTQEFFYGFLLVAVFSLSSSMLNLISAFHLKARNRRTFSLVVSGVNCVHWPFGTVLGIATIVVLRRLPVRALYDQRS